MGRCNGMLLLIARSARQLAHGKTPHEHRFEQLFDELIILCCATLENHSMFPRNEARLHQFGGKVIAGFFFFWICISCGKKLEGRHSPQLTKENDKTTLHLQTCKLHPDHLAEYSTEGKSLWAKEMPKVDNARKFQRNLFF